MYTMNYTPQLTMVDSERHLEVLEWLSFHGLVLGPEMDLFLSAKQLDSSSTDNSPSKRIQRRYALSLIQFIISSENDNPQRPWHGV